MTRLPETDPPVDTLVLLILFGVLLFASPVVLWWTDPQSPWYLPYLLWLLLIGLGGWLFGRHDKAHTDRRRGP
jgi:drug/metabolite transporter (DMT)-like permease